MSGTVSVTFDGAGLAETWVVLPWQLLELVVVLVQAWDQVG